uniref:uncharacterized protein n=1 Tax=Myxine glutinosa TaxID=7769 RepID=UPI00358FB1CB
MSWASEQCFGPWEQRGIFDHVVGHNEPLDLSRQKLIHLQYDKCGALDLSLTTNGHNGDKQDQPGLDAVLAHETLHDYNTHDCKSLLTIATPHERTFPEHQRPSSETSTKTANNVPAGTTMHQSRLHTFLAKLCCHHQSLLLQILRSNVPSHCSRVVQTPSGLQSHSGASQLPAYSLPWIRAEANFESYRHSPLENRASHNGHATFEYIQPALFPRSCSYQPIPNISYQDGIKWLGNGKTDALGSRLDTKGIAEDCVGTQTNTMHPLDHFILREKASMMVKREHNAQETLSTPTVGVWSPSAESSSISVQGISNSTVSSTPASWNKSNRSTQPTSNGFITSQQLGHPQEFTKGKQPAAVLSQSDGSVVNLQGFNGNKLEKSFEEVQAFPKMTNKVVDNHETTNFLQPIVSYQHYKQDLVLSAPGSVWGSWLDNDSIPMTLPVEKGSYLTGAQVGGEYWRHDVLLNENMKVNYCLNDNKRLDKLGGDCLDNTKCSDPATVNESQGATLDDLNSRPTDNKLLTIVASSIPSGPASDLTGQQDIVYVGHSGSQEQNGSLTVTSTPITFSPQRHSARKSTRGHLYTENHYELQTLWLTSHSRKSSEVASDVAVPLAQSLLDSHNLTTDMHDSVASMSCDEITNHNCSHKFDHLTSNNQLLQASEIQNIAESVSKVKLQQNTSGGQACENVMEFNKFKESLEDSTQVLEENDSQWIKHHKRKVQRKRKKGQKLVVALESLCRFRRRPKLDERVKEQGKEAHSRSILHLPENDDQIILTSVCNGNEEKEDPTPTQRNSHIIKEEDSPAPLSVAKSHVIETIPPAENAAASDAAASDEALSLSTVEHDTGTCSRENGPHKQCRTEKKGRKRKREFAVPIQNSNGNGMILRKRHRFSFNSAEQASNGTYCEANVLNASNFMHNNFHKISTSPSSVIDDYEEVEDNPEEMHDHMKSTAKCQTPWPLISRPELSIVVWNPDTEMVDREVHTSECKLVGVPCVEGLDGNMEDEKVGENDERLQNTSSLSGSVMTRCQRHLRTTRDKRNVYCRGKTSLGFLISVDAETLKQRTVIASAELLISAPFGDFDFNSDEELEETMWKKPRRRKYKKRLLVNNSKNAGAKKRGRKPRASREVLSIPSRDCADDIFLEYTSKTNSLQDTRGMESNENECFDALPQNLVPFADSAKKINTRGTYSVKESCLADLLLYGISENDLALIDSKFEQANRLWVPLQKAGSPLLKPARVKCRSRVEKDQPESNLKTSSICQLFSNGLNLPEIYKWFKEPTEDRKWKYVSKVDDCERPTSFVKPEDKRTTKANKNNTSVADAIESCIRQDKCSQMQLPSFIPPKPNSGGLTTREPKQPLCGIEQASHLQSKSETYHNSSSLQGTCIC